MPPEAPDLAHRALVRRKREDTATALPGLGILLLASPLLDLVTGPATLLGIPVSHIWVFGWWLGLILVTRALSRRLVR